MPQQVMKAIFRNVFILLTYCLISNSTVYAAPPDSLIPPHSWVKDYQSRKDYQYKTEAHNPTTGFEILLRWISNVLYQLFYSHNALIFWKYFLYTGALIIIIGIIWYFNRFGTSALRRQSSKKMLTGILSEDIHALDFEDLITEAEKNYQYRLAMRWQYLKYLKHLDDSHIIAWQQNKTNSDYKLEISDPAGRYKFSRIARGFENVWYGEASAGYKDYVDYVDLITAPLTAPVL